MNLDLDGVIREYKKLLDSRDVTHKDEPAKRHSFSQGHTTSFGAYLQPKRPEKLQDPPPQLPGVPELSCPELTLACDSITASKSKCVGFAEFGTPSDPPKFYRTRTTTISGSWSSTRSTSYGIGNTCGATIGESYSDWETVESYNDSCVLVTTSCTGTDDLTSSTFRTIPGSPGSSCSGSETRTITNCGGDSGWSGNGCIGCPFPSPCSFGFTTSSHTITTTSDVLVETYGQTGTCTDWSTSGSKTTSIVLSDEITAEDVCAEAIAALPSYSGTFGCGGSHTTGQDCLCSAYRNLSDDESSCTIRRFKHIFLFTAPIDGVEFDITWCEKFTPEGGGSPTYTSRSWHYNDTGDDNSDVFTVNEPDTDGTIDICCIRCCITAWPDVAEEDLPACDSATCP